MFTSHSDLFLSDHTVRGHAGCGWVYLSFGNVNAKCCLNGTKEGRRFGWILTERGARPPGELGVGQALYFQ